MSRATRSSGISFGAPQRVIGRRWWLVALVGGALAAVSLAPGAALAAAPHARVTGHVRAWPGHVRAWPAALRGTPTETIDANTDPQGAGQALNSGCADLSDCSWQATSPITVGYGPPQILGDALYNCSDPSNEQAYAETAVGISDEREESTSISETVSVEVELGFLGFEQSTAEFDLFSKQAESFSTEVTTTNAVAVAPGWKGWTETEVLTASVTGNAYITAGINQLIEVTNIDLNFPGYTDPTTTNDSPIQYIGYRTPMTAQDIALHCSPITGLGGTRGGTPVGKPRPAPAVSLKLTVCARQGRCVTRKASGALMPSIRHATATLTRGGRTYATGSYTPSRIRLTTRRAIRTGKYTLTIVEHPRPSRRGTAR